MTAAQMIERSNIPTIIANGDDPNNLIKIINGEKVGTKIV